MITIQKGLQSATIAKDGSETIQDILERIKDMFLLDTSSVQVVVDGVQVQADSAVSNDMKLILTDKATIKGGC